MIMSKKLSVKDLIKNKEKFQIKEDVTAEVYISRLDANIKLRKPERSLCMETIQMTQDDNLADQADAYMVYNICVEPNLKDADLQKAYGCVEPTDIVSKIFETGEIPSISQVGLELAGYDRGVKRVEDIKN